MDYKSTNSLYGLRGQGNPTVGGPIAGSDREPDVISALGDLMITAERLNGVADRLAMSLGPVMRPSEPQPECGQKQQEPLNIPVSNRIREANSMFMRAEEILIDAHRRLEI